MKWILLYQICSLTNSFCYPPLTDREALSYSECVSKGANKTIELVRKAPKEFDEQKYIVKYWCLSEDYINKTPASYKSIK